jgi:hypothetical protein
MADVFISYKQDERQAVDTIAAGLRALGLSVWFDARLSAGESFSDEIDREARNAGGILVCWSPSARESRWVKAEAMIGFEHDKLVACYVAGPDDFSPPAPFNMTCVDGPFGARRIFGFDAWRVGRVLTCVRPR